MRSQTTVGTAAEAPVLVQLSVHHQIVTGYRIAAVAIDRTETQTDLRALRQGDARDRHRPSCDPPDDRCRRLQPDHLLDEYGYRSGFSRSSSHRSGRRANSSIVVPIAEVTVSSPARMKTKDSPNASASVSVSSP